MHPLIRRTIALVTTLTGALLAHPATAHAQQFDVKGIVVDSTHAAVSGAMVVALRRKDSTIAVFSTSTGSGRFVLKRLVPGDYILQVTGIGYKPVRRDFGVTNADVTADTVTMLAAGLVKLGELVVTAEHVPIVNKPDTVEYNAEAFKTRINATVEELLKRLPGMTVGSDGTITAQGQTVQKVLVDGKEFFGNDPKMATRNLPAAAINKVQVFDKKSDAAEFSGIDDGQEQKTVNLVLKPEARVGYFGRAVAGLGPAPNTDATFAGSKGDDPRYSTALNLNRFSPTTQLSVIGSRNNVAQSGFSLAIPVMIGRGGPGGGGGGSTGFNETMALGLNGSQQFNDRSWVRGSYFYGTSDDRQQSVTDQQLLQGSSISANQNQTATNLSTSLSHRINLNAQEGFNAWTQLRFRGNFSAGPNNSDNVSTQETRTPDGAFQNSATSSVSTDAHSLSGDGRFTFMRRFNQAGRSLTAEAWGNLSKPDQLSDVNSSTNLTDGAGGIITRDILQSQRRTSRTFTSGERIGLTNPLGNGAVLELFGQHREIAENQHYDVNNIVGGTPVPDTALSNGFDRTYSYLNGGSRLSRNTTSLRWVVGLEVQNSDLQGTILNRDQSISNGFTNLLPSANLRYQFNQGSNFTFNYQTSTVEPSLTQLQPFVDNTDPLRTYVGNPDLTPQYQHNVRADFRRFDQFSFQSIDIFANLGYSRNEIVDSRVVDAQGRQTVTPINLGDGWTNSLGGSYGSPIRALGMQLDLNYNFSQSSSAELVNDVKNVTRNTGNTVGVRVQNRTKEVFDVSAGADWNFSAVKYSINTALNQSYVTSSYNADATWYPGETWTLNASTNYMVYDKKAFPTADNVFLLGASIGHQLLDNRAEVRLIGSDLLNENKGISITSTSSYIQQQRTATLGRQLIVQFTYQLGSNLRPGGKATAGRER